MTQFPELFSALGASFESQEVRVRSQAGRQLHYITARTAMNRLDSILGPENWWDEYLPGESSVICKLTVRLPDGSTLTKSDAGGYAGMADSGDDDKSGFSDAFKRAAVKFGVGRYLYRDGVPAFLHEREPAPVVTPPTEPLPARPTSASASAPTHPAPADPGPESPPAGEPSAHSTSATATAAPTANRTSAGNSAPRSGRALFAWTKDQEQRYQVGLLKYLNGWAKLQDYPGRMVDWDHDQVTRAYGEACRKLQARASAPAEEYEEALAN